MRTRIKVTICSHSEPNGASKIGRREQLKKKFQSGNITAEELREYATFVANSKRQTPTTVIVTIWGKKQYISYNEYKTRYEEYGFQCEIVY